MENNEKQPPQAVKPKKVRLPRTLGAKQFLNKKFTTLQLGEPFGRCLGEVEDNFSMIIYGESGHGKTEVEVKLAKAMTEHGNVLFNSKEQGVSKSLQDSWQRNNMAEIDGKIQVCHKESYDTTIARLKRKKSAKVVLLDSVQHMGMTYEMWLNLRAMFPKKIFILISHGTGNKPKGAAAAAIEFDVDVKAHVRDFVMHVASRFSGGGEPFIIYEKGYKDRLEKRKKKVIKIKKPKKENGRSNITNTSQPLSAIPAE